MHPSAISQWTITARKANLDGRGCAPSRSHCNRWTLISTRYHSVCSNVLSGAKSWRRLCSSLVLLLHDDDDDDDDDDDENHFNVWATKTKLVNSKFLQGIPTFVGGPMTQHWSKMVHSGRVEICKIFRLIYIYLCLYFVKLAVTDLNVLRHIHALEALFLRWCAIYRVGQKNWQDGAPCLPHCCLPAFQCAWVHWTRKLAAEQSGSKSRGLCSVDSIVADGVASQNYRHWSAEASSNQLLGSAKLGHTEPSDWSAAKKTEDGYQGKGWACVRDRRCFTVFRMN